jgi:hypothetical protein
MSVTTPVAAHLKMMDILVKSGNWWRNLEYLLKMKTKLISCLLFSLAFVTIAGEVTDPQSSYLIDYEEGAKIKCFKYDLNGDGVLDWFFNAEPSELDAIDRQAINQNDGRVAWDIYVSKPNSNVFVECQGIDEGGGAN